MKTNVVYKKIVLIRLCELLVGCRADGVICMLYETLCHYGFKDVIREGLESGRISTTFKHIAKGRVRGRPSFSSFTRAYREYSFQHPPPPESVQAMREKMMII